MQDDDEILDLVDKNDLVIGRMSRKEIHDKHLTNFRAVNGFIINRERKLWIPRRTADKSIAPLGLDMSVGGHVTSGETYEQAFWREVREELNIDLDDVPYEEIGYFKASEHGLYCFQKLYLIRSDETPAYNPDDFVEYYWLRSEEILKRIQVGDKHKSDLPILLGLLKI